MHVFDDLRRPDMGLPRHGEADFAYLNRSGRQEAKRCRALVEEWLLLYPNKNRDAIIARLRSLNDTQHLSAFFELLVCALLVTTGQQVVGVEPKLSHTDKSPDFLFENSDGDRFYVECVLATGRSDAEAAAAKRLISAVGIVDATFSPYHFLDLTIEGAPSSPLKISQLRRELAEWVRGLPTGRNVFDEAEYVFEEHGVRLTLRPWLKDNPARNLGSIGVQHFPVRVVLPDQDVRGALKKKASRYGKLEHPYLVAVNALDVFVQHDAAVDALFGSQATIERHTSDGGITTEHGHVPDGLWHARSGPQRTRLSGVLSMQGVDPWNFARREPQLILNPWAAKPLPDFSAGTTNLRFEQGVKKITPGRSLGELLGLWDGWPADTIQP